MSLRTWFTAPALALALALASAGRAIAQPTAPVITGIEAERQALEDGISAAQSGKADAAFAIFKSVLGSPAFDRLAPAEQHAAWQNAARAAGAINEDQAAYDDLVKATASPAADWFDWRNRVAAAMRTRNVQDAVKSMNVLTRQWPASLNSFDDRAILQLLDATRTLPTGDAQRIELETALFEADWKARNPFQDLSMVWTDLARALLAKGDVVRARAVAARVAEPYAVVSMRIDRVFDPVIEADPARFDVDLVMTARIADLRARVAAAPESLAGVNALADTLLRSGRASEALALTEAALAQVPPAAGASPRFADMDQLVWTREVRARAMIKAGRAAQLLDELASAAGTHQQVDADVATEVNLAGRLAQFGRSKEALPILDRLDGRSLPPLARVTVETIRAEALMGLGDKAGLAKAVAVARSHVDDWPVFSFLIMAFASDDDEAAALLIRSLGQARWRTPMLMLLQDWRAAPDPTAMDKATDARLAAIRGRADVQSAIAAVGRIQRWNLDQPDL